MSGNAGEEKNDVVLSSRRVVTPDGARAATVGVAAGRIVEIADYDPNRGTDLGDVALLPGLVDTHVHFNEPGRATGRVLKVAPPPLLPVG